MTAERDKPRYAVDVCGWGGELVGYAIPVEDTPRPLTYDITFFGPIYTETYTGFPYSVEVSRGHDGSSAGVTYLQMLSQFDAPARPQVSPQPVEKKTYVVFEPWMIGHVVEVRRIDQGDKNGTMLWVGKLATYALDPSNKIYFQFADDALEDGYSIESGRYLSEIKVFDA